MPEFAHKIETLPVFFFADIMRVLTLLRQYLAFKLV